MSIASEIQDLNTNLTAAKNAITAKGGTVGDTGLAGLATEIATIPSGGSMEWGTVTISKGGTDVKLTINNEYEFEKLHFNTSIDVITIDNETFGPSDIKEVSLGNNVYAVSNNFLRYCIHLIKLDVPELIFVGNYFLAECTSFNYAIDTSNIITYGTYFLYGCAAFNQNLTLSSNLTNLPNYFMYNCDSMIGTVNVQNIDVSVVKASGGGLGGCFASENASAPCYTTGITFDGANKAAWKNKFPDRTNSPYRKILTTN